MDDETERRKKPQAWLQRMLPTFIYQALVLAILAWFGSQAVDAIKRTESNENRGLVIARKVAELEALAMEYEDVFHEFEKDAVRLKARNDTLREVITLYINAQTEGTPRIAGRRPSPGTEEHRSFIQELYAHFRGEDEVAANAPPDPNEPDEPTTEEESPQGQWQDQMHQQQKATREWDDDRARDYLDRLDAEQEMKK